MVRKRIKNILIIGSGTTEIGKDTETDAASIQIIRELAKLDLNLFFVTDDANSVISSLGLKVHFIVSELNVNHLITVIRDRKIDTILPILGNSRALQLVEQLNEADIISDLDLKMLGVTLTTIHNLQNPELMNRVLRHIKEPTIPTTVVETPEDAIKFAKKVGYPIIIKPIASLSKTNRQQCENEFQLIENLESSFKVSSTNQVAVEKSIVGYKEIEMTVLRDSEGTKLAINGAENFNPVGVHAGDSITFSPIQTLTDTERQTLRESALKVAEVFRVKGVCHVQFALEPISGRHFITRINPFFDRTTSFAARATGYPIAPVVAHVIMGKNLRDIELPGLNEDALALIEPTLDHLAVRFPTWSFASFKNADQNLNTQMKSTGAVMAYGRSMEEVLEKAIRSVDSSTIAEQASLDESQLSEAQLINVLVHPRAGELFYLLEALRRGYTIDELAEMTKIDAFYFYKLYHIIQIERDLRENLFSIDSLENAKYYGFGDTQIAHLWKTEYDRVRHFRLEYSKLKPTFKSIEPTAGEFDFDSTVFYSTFEDEDESFTSDDRKLILLGTANNQVGANGAAEYTTIQTILEAKRLGYKIILINNNPSAISLAPGFADKVYLEPLTVENCLNIFNIEKPDAILAQGKWEIVNKLVDNGIVIKQLPLSRTTRSENVDSDFMFVTLKSNEKISVLGKIRTNEEYLSTDLSALSQEVSNKAKRLAERETSRMEENGIFTVIFKNDRGHLTLTSIAPLSVQDLPFISFATGTNMTSLLVDVTLGQFTKLDNIQKITRKHNYTYKHVYPYKQFGLIEPQKPPFSLAIGAEIKRL
ncbi:ATP-binding protein [Pediococcus claussenii]|uniref:Carbamoyl-phosphate synthase, large subunit n=1 Tax=Pediococcus claussenii (strain ATCC BAA-344 / DSM 14800 / JCM 18046 / KCTC 3811 / LMG 21948 / P06) TaxID=701521 RepID=G8PDD8_PEDCP|nr:ATP-grasp domain-containing protein [Pediococcus claussenii]AEV95273.1 carbamoyl-phosphate synthase, large subunit [Pediococcus claussenii ATCC BAA-344]ANZ68809.1 carbamoyl-phosphate synthase large subunit [Pediococcus claussenii]ANZ70625.1 carbamoyl-phosphate synthase large subunit [Pediococcus claussenii]KRN19545.1 carB protein [Pediococcus claussenii]